MIYDWRRSYDDVFYVVGVLYVIDAFIFAAIPFLDRYQERHGLGIFAEKDANGGQYTQQTFRITKGSLSTSSLVHGDQADGVKEYGTTSSTTQPGFTAPPAKPPPPAGGFPRQNSQGQPIGDDPGGYPPPPQQQPQQSIYRPTSSNNPFAQAEYPSRNDNRSGYYQYQ